MSCCLLWRSKQRGEEMKPKSRSWHLPSAFSRRIRAALLPCVQLRWNICRQQNADMHHQLVPSRPKTFFDHEVKVPLLVPSVPEEGHWKGAHTAVHTSSIWCIQTNKTALITYTPPYLSNTEKKIMTIIIVILWYYISLNKWTDFSLSLYLIILYIWMMFPSTLVKNRYVLTINVFNSLVNLGGWNF